MNPCMISSVEMPSLDFVQSLAHTLAEYGVDENEVFALTPGLINFIQYLLADAEDLEETVLDLRTRVDQQTRDLRRIRTQRNGLLAKLRGHDEAAERAQPVA